MQGIELTMLTTTTASFVWSEYGSTYTKIVSVVPKFFTVSLTTLKILSAPLSVRMYGRGFFPYEHAGSLAKFIIQLNVTHIRRARAGVATRAPKQEHIYAVYMQILLHQRI